jgi:hypothetical protein
MMPRERIEAVCADMEQADKVTLRENPLSYPPDQRKAPMDWIAVRCEVQGWLAALRAALKEMEKE